MPIKILMPALSPTMTEGTLSNWLKSEGDAISPGDVIAEIETDKATMEVEAVDDGVLGKIVVPSGTENVAVNAVIGVLLEEGEDASALSGIDLSTPGAPAEAPSGNGAAAPASVAPAAEAAIAAPAAAPPPEDHRRGCRCAGDACPWPKAPGGARWSAGKPPSRPPARGMRSRRR